MKYLWADRFHLLVILRMDLNCFLNLAVLTLNSLAPLTLHCTWRRIFVTSWTYFLWVFSCSHPRVGAYVNIQYKVSCSLILTQSQWQTKPSTNKLSYTISCRCLLLTSILKLHEALPIYCLKQLCLSVFIHRDISIILNGRSKSIEWSLRACEQCVYFSEQEQ